MSKLNLKAVKFEIIDGDTIVFEVKKILEVFSNYQSILTPMPIIVKFDVSKRYSGEFDFLQLMVKPSKKNMLNLIYLKSIGLVTPK